MPIAVKCALCSEVREFPTAQEVYGEGNPFPDETPIPAGTAWLWWAGAVLCPACKGYKDRYFNELDPWRTAHDQASKSWREEAERLQADRERAWRARYPEPMPPWLRPPKSEGETPDPSPSGSCAWVDATGILILPLHVRETLGVVDGDILSFQRLTDGRFAILTSAQLETMLEGK